MRAIYTLGDDNLRRPHEPGCQGGMKRILVDQFLYDVFQRVAESDEMRAMINVSHLEDIRTTNHTEGHNKRLSLRLFGGHINFWTFLALLRKEIQFQRIHYMQFTGGAKFRKRSYAIQQREDKILDLKRRYYNRQLTMINLLNEMKTLL